MFRLLVFVFAALAAFGADDWGKVRELKTGTELRIYKKGASQFVAAIMDEASADRLVAVIKNEQVAIAKDDIDRIDYRPPRPGARVTKETTTTVTESHEPVAAPGSQGGNGTSTSTSTGYSFQPKPNFETIYRRPPAPVAR
jgi:hypothetical protein